MAWLDYFAHNVYNWLGEKMSKDGVEKGKKVFFYYASLWSL
jgi:hypothetical protein